jgi:hypothetical protein
MSNRQTADLVALILASVVAVAVVGTVLVILWNELTVPEYDAGDAADGISKIISTLIGALVGYMAGRKVNGS